jgi:hypothetical protein
VQIAPLTRKRQIRGIVRAAVFPSHNVLHVVPQFRVLLLKQAILTLLLRPPPDQVPQRLVHD